MFKDNKELFHLYIKSTIYEKSSLKVVLQKSLYYLLADSLKFIRSLFSKTKIDNEKLIGKNVIFIGSLNNYHTLKFLKNELSNTIFVTPGGYSAKVEGTYNIRNQLNTYNCFSKYLFIIYLLLHSKLRVSKIDQILKWYGLINIYRRILKVNPPNSIIISNDHYPTSRALILAAQKIGVKCIYIQHASVSKYFPPLRFSHALLYGQYSKDIYQKIGDHNTKVYQVGIHQFDYVKQLIENKELSKRIGIAFNTLDGIKQVNDFYEQLSEVFPNLDVIVRPHPRDKRKLSGNINISSASKESAVAFLSKIDILVAGNSSILLEAALMNVLPLQYDFEEGSEKLQDYYGFIKTGLATKVSSTADVIKQINNFYSKNQVTIRQKAKIYDASVDSDFEFKVEKKIIEIIKNNILK